MINLLQIQDTIVSDTISSSSQISAGDLKVMMWIFLCWVGLFVLLIILGKFFSNYYDDADIHLNDPEEVAIALIPVSQVILLGLYIIHFFKPETWRRIINKRREKNTQKKQKKIVERIKGLTEI